MKSASPPLLRRQGKAVAASSGIIIGCVKKLMRGRKPAPEREIIEEQIGEEVSRLMSAVGAAVADIDIERDHLEKIDAKEPLRVLDMHRMLITDPELVDKTKTRISETLINAEWALQLQMDQLHSMFAKIEDKYLRNRKDDMEQAGRRILNHLIGHQPVLLKQQSNKLKLPVIYVGDDFSAAEVVSMWRQGVAGVIMEQGGAGAHNIIVARGIGLPALVGASDILADIKNGETLILDAEQSLWILNAPENEQQAYHKFTEAINKYERELQAYAAKPSLSLDGYELKLMANVEFAEELEIATHVNVDGIGLYRSEFLFMNAAEPPNEEQQFQQYASLVHHMAGKPVTLRLLDIGGDKPGLYHELTGSACSGPNPAMGLRGVRWLLRRQDTLRTQLRAMLRAGEEGPVHILIPMVTQCEEVEQVREIAELCRQSMGLTRPASIGTMIEVPATPLIADELAKVSDFFSVGSNDLIQYSLAADRSDEEVASFYQPDHPAILQLIKLTSMAAKKADIPISICGELAANPDWTETFLNLGMDSLSMSLNNILPVRRTLGRSTYQPIL